MANPNKGDPPLVVPLRRLRDDLPHYSLTPGGVKELKAKIKDIIINSQRHKHGSLAALNACCTVEKQFVWALIEMHGLFADLGRNGGKRCTELAGPCACGREHYWGVPRDS